MTRGLLAGAVADANYARGNIRAWMPRFVEPNLSRNLRSARRFDVLAADLGLTPAQLSLAWTLERGEHVVPIPGATSLAHLEENVGATAVSLAPEVIAQVAALFDGDAIHGPRYPAKAQAQVATELLANEILA